VGLANFNVFIISLGPLLGPAIVMPFLQQPVWTGIGFGIAATAAALVKVPANAVASIASVSAGVLTRRVSVRAIMIPAAVASAIGWFGLAFAHDSFWLAAALIIIFVVPSGSLLLVMTPQIIIQSAPEERTSEATGLTQVVRAFGKAIGVQIIALCFASSQVVSADHRGSFPAESAYEAAFIISGILSLISLMLVFALPRGSAGAAPAEPGTGGDSPEAQLARNPSPSRPPIAGAGRA
jgi:fucose permease